MQRRRHFSGAAPITLIDGDKLMELLLKHGVGVKKRQATLIEIDESIFYDQVAGNEAGVSPPDEVAHPIE